MKIGEPEDRPIANMDRILNGGMIHGQGEKEQTAEGAVRESNQGRGRFDLLPYEALEAWAKWSELGAEKYGERNWEDGLSVKDLIGRMFRHAAKASNGWTDEDHLAAVIWNAAAAITMMKRRPDCNDHPWQEKMNQIQEVDDYIKANPRTLKADIPEIDSESMRWMQDAIRKASMELRDVSVKQEVKNDFSLGQEVYILCPGANTVGKIIAKNGELYNVKFDSGYVGVFYEREMAAIVDDAHEQYAKQWPMYPCPSCHVEVCLTPTTPRHEIVQRGMMIEAFRCPTCNESIPVAYIDTQLRGEK